VGHDVTNLNLFTDHECFLCKQKMFAWHNHHFTVFLQFFLSKQMVILYFDVAVAFCSWMLRMGGMKHDDVNL